MAVRAIRPIVLAAGLLALTLSAPAWTGGHRFLQRHVPAAVARLQPIGDLPGTNRLRLSISLPLRHQDALNSLLRDLYNPASASYRHFLKPREFADQFGPSEEDYQALIAFAQAHHLEILRTQSNRVLLDVAAWPADVRDAFHVNMKVYQHPCEARTFYAPDAEPSIDLDIPWLHISGLDNYSLPRPMLRGDGGGRNPISQIGSGKNGTYLANDLRAAYVPGVTLDGAGQSLALVEFDTYYTNDILAYEGLAGLQPVPITNVLVDGFDQKPQGGNEEVAVDIEMAMAMAPGLAQILVYEDPYQPSGNNDILNQIATDDLANQISCSWFFAIDGATDQIFQQMAAQGQSFFNACGDFGAYAVDMAAKEADPFITQVGGTILSTSGPGGNWTGESAWQSGSGGISTARPIPYWQQAVNMSSNQGSPVWRNVPDVAFPAATILVVYDNGVTNGQSGTSLAAPLWAAFTALANQQGAQNGQPPVGFLNPALYGIGQSSLYASCFHDIKSGNNTNDLSPNKFFAVKGYDLCTGWGTPAGQPLIDALAPVDNLIILPQGGLSLGLTNNSTASEGSVTLILTNSGAASLNWSLGPAPAWLQFSASNGLVLPGQAASLALTATSVATNLAATGYATDLMITNMTSNVVHDVPIFLAVSDPLILTPATGMAVLGPVGGPFNLTSQIVSLSNAAVGPLQWKASSGSAFLDAAPSGGTLAPGQVTNVTLALAASASNLLISATTGGIGFADLTTGATQALPFALAVGNGGFETGDFSDWIFTGDTNANTVGAALFYFDYVHSGGFAAIFGEPTNFATLSQILPTSAGSNYLISFWLDNPVGGNPNEFKAAWNGVTLFDQTNMPRFLYTNMEFVASATSAATTLEFFFQNKPDAFGFDDVSVTAIVPPAFASMAITNGGLLFNWSAVPGLFYQLQYATNLAMPLWINSGSPILATNGAVSVTNPLAADPQRFYRVGLAIP